SPTIVVGDSNPFVYVGIADQRQPGLRGKGNLERGTRSLSDVSSTGGLETDRNDKGGLAGPGCPAIISRQAPAARGRQRLCLVREVESTTVVLLVELVGALVQELGDLSDLRSRRLALLQAADCDFSFGHS